MAGEDWQRLADYVVARRVELGMRDRRAFAEATGVTERTLGKLENGQRVSPSTLGMVENRLGWAPGSCRRLLAGGEPNVSSPDRGHAEYEDPTLWHLASTPGLPPDVVRGLVALARNWRQAATAQKSRPTGALDRGRPPRQAAHCTSTARSRPRTPSKSRQVSDLPQRPPTTAPPGAVQWAGSCHEPGECRYRRAGGRSVAAYRYAHRIAG